MRLLGTTHLTPKEFYDAQIPPYAIVSHRWPATEQEVSYADLLAGRKKETTGYAKIERFCELAKQQNLEYCWNDTCCIDKGSSAELTEAINSMFQYYQQADISLAYLADKAGKYYLESDWWERGWTLQELIAPKDVLFVGSDGRRLGTRHHMY